MRVAFVPIALLLLLTPLGGQDTRQEFLAKCLTYLGVPYHHGGRDRLGIDDAGLVGVNLARLGILVPHDTLALARLGQPLPLDKAQPGDLVFFDVLGLPAHVGVYLGEGRFLHASREHGEVRMDSLRQPPYSARLRQALDPFALQRSYPGAEPVGTITVEPGLLAPRFEHPLPWRSGSVLRALLRSRTADEWTVVLFQGTYPDRYRVIQRWQVSPQPGQTMVLDSSPLEPKGTFGLVALDPLGRVASLITLNVEDRPSP